MNVAEWSDVPFTGALTITWLGGARLVMSNGWLAGVGSAWSAWLTACTRHRSASSASGADHGLEQPRKANSGELIGSPGAVGSGGLGLVELEQAGTEAVSSSGGASRSPTRRRDRRT